MKAICSRRIVLVILLLLVFTGAVFVVADNSRVRAAQGNSGVPVRCFKPGSALAPGNATFLSCVAADGTPFESGQRVPNGYYLLVLDVLVTPDAGTDVTTLTDVTIYDAYGDSSRQSSFRLRDTSSSTYGRVFGAPYLVLSPGHRLEVTNAAFSESAVEVRISGLLVTNLSYIPLALSQ